MRLTHLHLPNITPFTRVSHLQETLTTRLLAYKKLTSGQSPTPTTPGNTPITPPDPTIITFTPNPVYTTGRRDLPPSNTASNKTLSLPPGLEPIRSLLVPAGYGKNWHHQHQHQSAHGDGDGDGDGDGKAEYHPTLRGGQTTYHGPGQMVAYTILDLKRLGLTPRCHIRVLENSVVDVLGRYGIPGVITEDPGVWVPSPSSSSSSSGTGAPKKITAVGVHLRRNISSYGIGFNVTDEPMWYFRQIVACGLEGREATSLEGQGMNASIKDVAGQFVEAFTRRINADFACGDGASGEKIDEVYNVREEDLLRS